MENKIQEIKEVIWKANPSILELKFGCRVKIKGLSEEFIIIDVHTDITGKNWNFVVRKSLNQQMFREVRVEEIKKYVILGRPIHLSDVLLAIDKTYKGRENHDLFMDGLILENMTTEGKTWNLHDDDLSHQSEETINFLHKILVGENK